MAITNHERVGKALVLLRDGLRPFVERELKTVYKDQSDAELRDMLSDTRLGGSKGAALEDVAVQLVAMDRHWGDIFRNTLGKADRSYVNELLDVRHKWAHQKAFSSNDADRAMDSAARLLTAVSASQADEVDSMKRELRRLVDDEQVRSEKRKVGGSLIELTASSVLQPWREVVMPHADVASGRYQQAEFAADLYQVFKGEGTDEYRKPQEFFRRTYLTESLKSLLVRGIERVSGKGGDPVVQLQTNFGGGKTHSMLALYHLFSGANPHELPGVDAVLAKAGVTSLPKVKRVVFVGNKTSPGCPQTKDDGTVVHTVWGELAWQLGGKKAYARVRADDERATNPGDVLRELFKEYGPCLILVDEWVAYARQLHDQSDLPGGSFDTQFTFAQTLTESAKLAGNCLLVISLPASDTSGSPHAQADDIEVGGIRGREALDRLRNVVGRLESSWRPATAEESFEIVRRRLFDPLAGPEAFKQRDVTARAFSELYQSQSAEFPQECKDGAYEQRIKAAYPIHPEIFDRLYTDWSTLPKFQRTRGVLRLMAAVIHCLWENGDRNPMILPSTVPIDDPRVQSELTRYLSDNWAPIIEKDVDGPDSLPRKIDAEVPNLGKMHATRRVARTIYIGSAPKAEAAHRGIEDRRIKLGCVMPGESPAVFGDALRRLTASATYLYQDGPRCWYSTQPTVTKLAEDRAEQFKRDPDRVAQALEARLRADLSNRGDFQKIHPLPRTGADVPDDRDTRLVVLPPEHAYIKEPGCPAEMAARAILDSRGNTPRLFKNTLVFLAADKARLQDLDEAVRKHLAWESILAEKQQLNLDPAQVRQAETQRNAADATVVSRLPETYQWLLAPEQASPSAPIVWRANKVGGSDALAVRVSKRLRSDELMVGVLASTVLRKTMDDVPLWAGDHVPVRQLVEYFAKHIYLNRLRGPDVLVKAIQDGIGLLSWQSDTFACAESYDDATKRYRGLRCGRAVAIDADSAWLVVKPDVARQQNAAELAAATAQNLGGMPGGAAGAAPGGAAGLVALGTAAADNKLGTKPAVPLPRRFHGTVQLDSSKLGYSASIVNTEVIAHLAAQLGAKVTVTLEIQATLPSGATDQIVRTVTENCRTLKFTSQGFEQE